MKDINRKSKKLFCGKLVKPLISTNNVKCPQSIFITSAISLDQFFCASPLKIQDKPALYSVIMT